MESNNRIWAVVPAAGIGSRMQANIPKQYLPLAGKTVLQITLQKLLAVPELAGCVVAVSADDPYFSHYCGDLQGVTAVTGGAERADSVYQGLQHVIRCGGEHDWVLVHDAARPCVRPENLQKLISKVLQQGRGGLLAAPVADTLKRVSGELVAATVDRSNLWQAHTPQMFRAGELREALEAARSQGLAVTDEASAMEAAGVAPVVVTDSRDNIKITQAEDLALAAWILEYQMNPAAERRQAQPQK